MLHKTLLIMAGGTGGHIYPALAVADYLRECGINIHWLGSRSGLEKRIVPEHGYPLSMLNISGLRGNGIFNWLLAPFKLLLATSHALLILYRHKPSVVLGMGGFVSGPGGLAAWLLRIPLFIHEQNAIAGMTNRILAPMACMVMQGFPGVFDKYKNVRTTGNPVRCAITRILDPAQRLNTARQGPMCLLILGGSQGAKKINQTVPAALKQLSKSIDIKVWHQTGNKHLTETRHLYQTFGCENVRIVPYIEDMVEAYNWADLVLCRAGAITIAELCVAGLASILVPFPYAVDNHQTANAHYLSDYGAAVLLPESELDETNLAGLLRDFYHAHERLLEMAKKSRELAFPKATDDVATLCLEAVNA